MRSQESTGEFDFDREKSQVSERLVLDGSQESTGELDLDHKKSQVPKRLVL